MYKYLSSVLILSFIGILSGCAAEMGFWIGIEETKRIEQRFIHYKAIDDPTTFSRIRSIALLNIPNPHHYLPYDLSNESSETGKEAKYEGLNFSGTTEEFLIQLLKAEGYDVTLNSVKRKNQYKLVDDYSDINIPGADAVLDVIPVEIGFTKSIHPPFTRKMRPHISIVVRLVSAHTKKILYAETFQYGYGMNPLIDGTRIKAHPNHFFENKDALKTQNQKAVEQLIYGINAITQAIAKKFTR